MFEIDFMLVIYLHCIGLEQCKMTIHVVKGIMLCLLIMVVSLAFAAKWFV